MTNDDDSTGASGLELDTDRKPAPASRAPPTAPKSYVPRHLPAARELPEGLHTPEWSKDLRMYLLWALVSFVFLLGTPSRADPGPGLPAAALASLAIVSPLFVGSRWFAFLNRHFGVVVAWLFCGFFPAVFSAINLALYEMSPRLYRWRNIGIAWAAAVGLMFAVHH